MNTTQPVIRSVRGGRAAIQRATRLALSTAAMFASSMAPGVQPLARASCAQVCRALCKGLRLLALQILVDRESRSEVHQTVVVVEHDRATACHAWKRVLARLQCAEIDVRVDVSECKAQ